MKKVSHVDQHLFVTEDEAAYFLRTEVLHSCQTCPDLHVKTGTWDNFCREVESMRRLGHRYFYNQMERDRMEQINRQVRDMFQETEARITRSDFTFYNPEYAEELKTREKKNVVIRSKDDEPF